MSKIRSTWTATIAAIALCAVVAAIAPLPGTGVSAQSGNSGSGLICTTSTSAAGTASFALKAQDGRIMAPDGNTVFVASWGRGEVSRFGRNAVGGLSHQQTVEMKFRVDNLRWSRRGTLYAAGHRLSRRQDCGTPLCIDEWEVAELDPATMEAQTLVVKKPVVGFTGATVAIDADDGLLLGTFQGDRLVFISETEH